MMVVWFVWYVQCSLIHIGVSMELGHWQEAYTYIRRALPANPYSHRLAYCLNRVLCKLSFHRKCITFLERLWEKRKDR